MKTIILDYDYEKTHEKSTFMRAMELKTHFLENGMKLDVDFDIFHTYNKIHVRFLTDQAAAMETYLRMMI